MRLLPSFQNGTRRSTASRRLPSRSLDAETIDELTFDLLEVNDEAGLEEFIKKLTRTVTKAARDVARTGVGKVVTKAVSDVGQAKIARQISKAAQSVVKDVGKVGKAVPMLGTIAKLASRGTPLGLLARSTYGALSAALKGQNVFMGALDGLSGTPLFAAAVKIGGAAIRGENLIAAAKMAAKAGIADVREAVRFAAMVAPFVPGLGTGIGAALGAADALANGQPITQALIAGVRGAIPGGVIAQAAFDTAAQLVQGKRLDQALLTAARNRLPPGPGAGRVRHRPRAGAGQERPGRGAEGRRAVAAGVAVHRRRAVVRAAGAARREPRSGRALDGGQRRPQSRPAAGRRSARDGAGPRGCGRASACRRCGAGPSPVAGDGSMISASIATRAARRPPFNAGLQGPVSVTAR